MRVVVIGLGNPFRNDDAAGIEVARRLRDARVPGLEVYALDGEPLRLIDHWSGADVAYIVDAVAGEGAAGTIHRIEVGNGSLPDGPRHDSTHAVALGDVIALARVLDRMPRRVVVIGIEGQDFAAGTRLTPAVSEAIGQVVDMLALAPHGNNGGGH